MAPCRGFVLDEWLQICVCIFALATCGHGIGPTFDTLDDTITSVPDNTANGTSLYSVTYTDDGSCGVGTISLLLLTFTTEFNFNPATGDVTVASGLTDIRGNNVLQFRVSDDCNNAVTGTLTIPVHNVPPTVNNGGATANVSEHTYIETLLMVIDVTDLSDIPWCELQSTIPPGGPFFVRRINNTSEMDGIFLRPDAGLSFDNNLTYLLTVTCTDFINTDVSAVYVIRVLENKPPIMLNLPNRATVSARTTAVGHVFTVNSTDPEGDQLFYNFTSSFYPCPFALYNSGSVLLTDDLMYLASLQPSYALDIYVYDGHTLVGPQTLNITVNGIDNAPVITSLPLATPLPVNENSALGSSISQIVATDADSDPLTYVVTSYSPIEGVRYFSVDSTGEVRLSLTNGINYEAILAELGTTNFTLTVSVFDGFKTDTANLDISVIDVNEAPYFTQSEYSIHAAEDAAGTLLQDAKFECVDPDGDVVTYSTASCGPLSCTVIVSDSTTGRLSYGTNCDWEDAGTPSQFNCTITCSDTALDDNATLTVYLSNVNDNNPYFVMTPCIYYVTTPEAVGLQLAPVTALDADLDYWGVVLYSVEQAPLGDDYFGVDSSGALFIQKSLVSLGYGTTVTFTVRAMNWDGIQTSRTCTVVIPSTTTTTTTTTTDRNITFVEDPNNIWWLVACALVGLSLVCVSIYIGVRYCRQGCIHCCRNIAHQLKRPRRQKPKKQKKAKKARRVQQPEVQRVRQIEVQRVPQADPPRVHELNMGFWKSDNSFL